MCVRWPRRAGRCCSAGIHRREAQFVLQALPVRPPVGSFAAPRCEPPGGPVHCLGAAWCEPPRIIGLAQAVHEHDDARGRIRKGGPEGLWLRRHLGAVAADLHAERKLALALDEVMAVELVESTEDQRPTQLRAQRGSVGLGPPRGRLRTATRGSAKASEHAAVDRAGDTVVNHSSGRRRRAENLERASGNALVHVLHQLAPSSECVAGERPDRFHVRPAHRHLLQQMGSDVALNTLALGQRN